MRRPRFIAEQARNARGPLGRLVAFVMARETWAQNRRAIQALDVGPERTQLLGRIPRATGTRGASETLAPAADR